MIALTGTTNLKKKKINKVLTFNGRDAVLHRFSRHDLK